MLKKNINSCLRDSYTGLGEGLYTGPSIKPYHNNWLPREVFLKCLFDRGLDDIYQLLKEVWGL